MSKRKIIIILGIVGIIILLVLGYSFLIKPTTNQTGQSTGTNFFSTIFPFLKNTNNNSTNPILNLLGIGGEEQKTPIETSLRKVSSVPVAGYGIFNKERFLTLPEIIPSITEPAVATSTNENTTAKNKKQNVIKPIAPPTEFVPAIKYTGKETGSVYQTYADKIDEQQITSNSIPVVHESLFGKNGESSIMRYLKDNNTIETFIKTLPKEILGGDTIDTSSVPGNFLTENITDLSISPDASQIFYLFDIQNGSVGVITDYLGINKTQIFNSPFTEWLSQWPNDRMITLTTKPSYDIPGFMYAVDPTKKDFNKILGGINGLTTLTSPNGKMVLYSSNNLSLYVYDTMTNNSRFIGLNTLPEKCVWNKTSEFIYCAVPTYISSGQYPDSWYMGEVSFIDELWKIDITSGNTTKILETPEEDMDIIKLGVDDNQKYLFFINKKDSYLWEFVL